MRALDMFIFNVIGGAKKTHEVNYELPFPIS